MDSWKSPNPFSNASFAAEQNGIPGKTPFPFADPKVSPSTLAGHLVGHSLFQEPGYLLPGAR